MTPALIVPVPDDKWCGQCPEPRGVLPAMDTPEGIQTCDTCNVYPGDLEAAAALASLIPGAVVRCYVDRGHKKEYSPEELDKLTARTVTSSDDLAPGEFIAYHTNPWIEVDGTPIDWTTYQLSHEETTCPRSERRSPARSAGASST